MYLLSTCMKTCALLIGAFAHTKTETAEQHSCTTIAMWGPLTCSISTNEKMACSHHMFHSKQLQAKPLLLTPLSVFGYAPPLQKKKKKKEQWQVAYPFQLVTNIACTNGFVCIYLHCYLILDLCK